MCSVEKRLVTALMSLYYWFKVASFFSLFIKQTYCNTLLPPSFAGYTQRRYTMADCGKNSQQPLRRRVSSGFCLVSRDTPLGSHPAEGLFMLPARRQHLEIVLSWCAARFLITQIGIVVCQCVRMHVCLRVCVSVCVSLWFFSCTHENCFPFVWRTAAAAAATKAKVVGSDRKLCSSIMNVCVCMERGVATATASGVRSRPNDNGLRCTRHIKTPKWVTRPD